MKYIWQHKKWPHFEYKISPEIQNILYQYAMAASSLSASLNALPKDLQDDARIDVMVSEAINTSRIEGENIDPEDVRSSIKNQLGLFEVEPELIKDPRAAGIARLMINVEENYSQPLTKEELFSWHSMIFSGPFRLDASKIGTWRTGKEPMQIVSGPIGRETVHFQAPPSSRVPKEMEKFVTWFNETHPTGKTPIAGPVRSAIAHLYFESIHPFEDGNGRIGRALSEKALLQELQSRFEFSLSTRIQNHKKEYYQQLSVTSSGDLDITAWIEYFVRTIYDAALDSKKKISEVVQKARFWKKYASKLNERQSKVCARMLEEGVDGFEGGINAQKYMKIAHCSKATATRDLAELLLYGCIEQLPGGGRNTSYKIKLP